MVNLESMPTAEQHRVRAWEAAETQNWELALQEVNAALELDPTEPLYWVLKGRFLRESGALAEAESVLEEALDISSSNKHVWTELGELYMSKELFEKAAFCLAEAARIEPGFCIYTLLANAELTFDPSGALVHARKALELKPNWEEAERIAKKAQSMLSAEDPGRAR